MSGLYSKLIKPIHFCGDIILINASFFLSYFWMYDSLNSFVANHYFSLFIFYNALWIILTTVRNAYALYRVQTIVALFNSMAKILFFYFVLIEVFCRVFSVFIYPLGFSLYSFLLISVSISLWRIFTIFSLRIYRKMGFNYRKVIIVGLDNSSKELSDFFSAHPEHGYKLFKLFDAKNYFSEFSKLIEDIKYYCVKNEIDEIYCSYSLFPIEQINNLIDFANQNMLRVKFLPDSMGLTLKQFKVDFYDYIPIFLLKPTPIDETTNKIIKRIFDIVFSLLIIIIIFSWLFPLLAIIIKLNSKGPVFFRQKRSGLDNKDFWCYKFRSMYSNQEADIVQATKGDMRITRVGAFLRKTSIDELPQFFNVLLGNMSVVGPRPHMLKHTKEYATIINKYMLRHFIKPGITGLAQVRGYRGETSDKKMMEKRVKMDIYYMENWSFLLDVKIVFQTIIDILIGSKNAG
ncbi:MAG: undecaprenyl-phosphate glucose phosphotransferase [Bacteroidota bacterium]